MVARDRSYEPSTSISPNQVTCVWERYEVAKIPQWAEEYFLQRMWEKR